MHGTAAIARRLGFAVAKGLGREWPSEAQHLDLGQAIELLCILASLSPSMRRRSTRLNVTGVDPWLHLQKGYSALVNWPNSFFALLDSVAAAHRNTPTSPSRPKLFGFARSFGQFYPSLASATDEPWLFLRNAFAKYAGVQRLTPIVGREDGAVYTAEDVAKRPLITPKEAQRLIGRKYASVRKLMDAGALAPALCVGGQRNRVFLDRADVEAICAGGPPLTKKEAATRLGFPPTKLEQLVDDRVVVALASPADKGTAHYLFAVSAIDELIAKVRACLQPDPHFKPDTYMKTLLRAQETLHISSAPVFEGILLGDLKVRGWDESRPGLAGALFAYREVNPFLHLIHDQERGDLDGLTTLRASYILRCNPMTVWWLLKRGLLEHAPSSTSARPRILRRSLDKHIRKRITAATIAREWRTNGAVIANALAAAGVQPLRDIDDVYGVVVYRRSDVDRTDLKTMIRLVGRRAGHSQAEYKRLWKADRRSRGLPIS